MVYDDSSNFFKFHSVEISLFIYLLNKNIPSKKRNDIFPNVMCSTTLEKCTKLDLAWLYQ